MLSSMVAHICYLSTTEAEAGRPSIQGLPEGLSYVVKGCLKNKKGLQVGEGQCIRHEKLGHKDIIFETGYHISQGALNFLCS